MAGKLFIGFDISKLSQTLLSHIPSLTNSAATIWNNHLTLPRGVYHNKGAATQDITITPPNNASSSGSAAGCTDAGRTIGASYGSYTGSQFDGSSATTRAVFAAAQGYQLGVNRSIAGIGNELWATFDIKLIGLPNSTLSSTFLPSASWGKIFKWGDVEIAARDAVWTSSHVVTFSVRNNGVEIATIEVPTVLPSSWLFCRFHVKLDSATGLIECEVGGVIQSVTYTGQNTVTTTSLATASTVFIGPPIFDNGTTAYPGGIDNIYFDDAAFPAGRPEPVSFTLLADDTLTNMAAFGAGATTVVSALADTTDAIAMRATASGGSAILTQTPPTTTSYLANVVCVEMALKRATNRNGASARRAELGYSLAGVQTLGIKSKATPLVFSNTANPPETAAASTFPVEQIFETSAAAKMTKTELATMKVVIKSSAP